MRLPSPDWAFLFRETRNVFGPLAVAMVGWLLIAPIALLVPRRRDWLAVIGRDDGQFVDNAKYFFIEAKPLLAPMRVAFVTGRRDVRNMLIAAGRDVLAFPSPPALWFLLRAGTTVVDSNEWWLRLRRFLLLRSRVVQLWHGVGFKRIEHDKWRNEATGKGWLSSSLLLRLRLWKRVLTGRQVRYAAVATTSRFYRDEVFAPAFRADHFPITGYPRNGFGRYRDVEQQALAWSNVDPAIAGGLSGWISAGRRVVLVAPTFRDSRATPTGLDDATVARLDDWCASNAAEIVFKFHPHERGIGTVRGRHLHLCRPGTDLYPLMPDSAALITDYSSIYMDYLLLDKPVLFLVPDMAQYLRRDRQFQFDYAAMTPGPKLGSWDEVMDALPRLLADDPDAGARARLSSLAFDGLAQNEAASRIIAFMRAKGWITVETGSQAARDPEASA